MVNQNLGNMLRFLIENHVKSSDFVIPQAEFAYNNFMNLKIKKKHLLKLHMSLNLIMCLIQPFYHLEL